MPYGPQYGRHQLGAGREQPSNIDLSRILFLLAVDLHGWRPLARVFGSLAYERRRVSAGARGGVRPPERLRALLVPVAVGVLPGGRCRRRQSLSLVQQLRHNPNSRSRRLILLARSAGADVQSCPALPCPALEGLVPGNCHNDHYLL